MHVVNAFRDSGILLDRREAQLIEFSGNKMEKVKPNSDANPKQMASE